MKDIWLLFFRATESGEVMTKIFFHNCVADFRSFPSFIGFKKVSINMDDLEK